MAQERNSKKLNSRQQRDLDIEIDFLEGLIQRDPAYVDALQLLGDDYTRRGRIPEGLKVDEQLAQLRPDDPLVHYNLACSLSLSSDCEKAARELERALDLGYADFQWMEKDPDLKAVRKHPAFARIRQRIQASRADLD